MNKYIKGIFIFLKITFLLFIILIIVGIYKLTHDPFDFDDLEYSSKKELVENYELKQKEITELYNYAKSITENGKIYVDIEFKNDKNIEIFRVEMDSLDIEKIKDSNSVQPIYYTNSYYDLKVKSKTVDTLLNKLNWTRETLKMLKTKLDAANCTSVNSGEPMTIGFKRNGLGMYYYKIFENALTDSLINRYNDGCAYIFYKDNVVLEYTGGAIGMQCFETYYNKEK